MPPAGWSAARGTSGAPARTRRSHRRRSSAASSARAGSRSATRRAPTIRSSAQGIVKALCDGEAAAETIAKFLAGAGEAPLLAYQDGVFARFTDYLRLRRHLYGLERRWPQAPFWQNRRLLCQSASNRDPR